MSDSWLDKAKAEAKRLAEAAKNANYGEMLEKTKTMAQQATDEAKKAASSVSASMSRHKTEDNAATPTPPAQTTESQTQTTETTESQTQVAGDAAKNLELCRKQLEKVESILAEIKALLK